MNTPPELFRLSMDGSSPKLTAKRSVAESVSAPQYGHNGSGFGSVLAVEAALLRR
jgi:hypothetical protein